jgi:hypothetical protein
VLDLCCGRTSQLADNPQVGEDPAVFEEDLGQDVDF